MKKEKVNTKLKPILKWLGFVVLILVLLFTITSFIAEYFIKKEIDKTKGLTVKTVNVSWLCNNVEFKNIIYQKNQNTISLKELNLLNFNWLYFLNNNIIHFNEIEIINGNINLNFPPKNKKSKGLENIKHAFIVNKTSIKNTNIHLIKNNKRFNVKEIYSVIENLKITPKNITFKNIQYATSKGIYNNINSDYELTWDKISTQQKTTTFLNFHLTPKPTEEEWKTKYTYKKSRLVLKIPQLSLNNINYHSLINKDSFSIKNITLKNTLLSVVTDENKKPDPNGYKPLLHELLYNTKLPVKITKAKLVNNRVNINVISKKTQKKGLIYFNKINATIFNIQNKKDHKINLNLKALVLNKNSINLNIDFWLTPKLFPYSIKGNVSPFDFEQFNTFLLLSKRIRVLSGECNRLDFSIYGNNNKATGDIILDYKNIKIGLFDKDEHIVEKLPTFLINQFLLKQNNIPNTKNYRTGNMYYKRPQNRSMFHSWWYTLKSGFQSVILPNLINPKELDH
ncbi:hypothetical protein [Wenyingzhuangia sp. IMCC45467]